MLRELYDCGGEREFRRPSSIAAALGLVRLGYARQLHEPPSNLGVTFQITSEGVQRRVAMYPTWRLP